MSLTFTPPILSVTVPDTVLSICPLVQVGMEVSRFSSAMRVLRRVDRALVGVFKKASAIRPMRPEIVADADDQRAERSHEQQETDGERDRRRVPAPHQQRRQAEKTEK